MRAQRARPLRRASSAPTRSSSTRTSGCSRRSTRARSSTASPPTAAPPTASTPSYLESLYADDTHFNPSDYGVHLTRRPRGLPFWFSLAVHGTDAYAEAVERTLAVTREAAEEIRARDELELVAEPELSVLVFRRLGWEPQDYTRWATGLRESGIAFVLPTTHEDAAVARLALVNPRTTLADIRIVLDAMI